MDIFPAAAQRPALLSFASALNSRPAALRRDAYGDWHILGRTGHVYAVPGGFLLVAGTESPRLWSSAKHRLAFCIVTQDGDGEGVLMLDRLPIPAEAAAIRVVLGIKKRKAVSPEHVERMRAGLQQRVGLAA